MTVTLTAPAPSPAPAADHKSDFAKFWFGETVSKIGTGVSTVALPLAAITTLHASTFQIGLLTAAGWLPWLLIGLPAGAWVDRMARRPLMITCNLVSFALLVSVPVSAWLGWLGFTQLLVTALLLGTAAVFFQTAYQVYLPSLLPPAELPAGNAKMHGSEAFAQVAGPGLAGGITQVLGILTGLLVNAATFLVSTVCLLRIRAREVVAPVPRDSSLTRDIREGLRFVVRDPYLRVFSAFGAAFNLAFIAYQAVLVVFLVREVGVDSARVGVLLMGMSAGAVLGAWAATRISRRFGSAHGLLLAVFGTAPFAVLIPLTAPGWRLILPVIGGAMVGAGTAVSNVIRGSFRQLYTPRPLLGRVSVSMMFLNFGTIPLGGIIGGALGQWIGVRPTVWIMAVTVACSPLFLLIGPLKRSRDLPAA
ncbi:MFS family permease [Hamadaea flava]|uniref:MFS transporter n=1 Tax=Hamadaea flava TaxID=1742688 RepID=A0ABV8LYP2_9ACTN|nr:MFS transporter [Hamadaea flava]MCP2322109.1 MFS family permease [Hamadaea flava]